MKIRFTFILIVIGLLSACSSIQRTTDKNEYDFLIIKEIYDDNWIDKEFDFSLISGKSDQMISVFMNGLEDNYILCSEQGNLYSTNQLTNEISFDFSQFPVFSDIDSVFPKSKGYEFKSDNQLFKVYKIKITGLLCDRESAGIKSEVSNDVILLPVSVELFRLTEKDKRFVKKKLLNFSPSRVSNP